MQLDQIKSALTGLFGGKDQDGPHRVSRRRMLAGIGSVGALAFAAPTLLMPSQADAAGVSIHIGPRFRRRRFRRYGYHPYYHRRPLFHFRLGRSRRRRRGRLRGRLRRRRRRW